MFELHRMFVVIMVLSTVAHAADWSQYRGPRGDAVSTITQLPSQWSDQKHIRWKTPLPGPGLSSPVVWKNHVYITCFTGFNWPKAHNEKKQVGRFKRHLICFDLKTGKIKWTKSNDAEHFDRKMDFADGYWQVRDHGFASSTPACDARGVYAYFGPEGLHAFTHDGKPRWVRSCGHGHHRTGSAASPVVTGDIVIVNATIEGGGLFGINADSGNVTWKLGRQSGYATPITHRSGNTSTVLIRSERDGTLRKFDPASGRQLWQSTNTLGPSYPSVVVAGDTIITLSKQAEFAAVGRDGDLKWRARGGPYFGTPVYHEGRLYYVNSGIFSCIDVDSGAFLYRERLPAKGHYYAAPVVADGKVYCVSRENGTCVVSASPKFKLLAHNTFESDDSYFNSTPAVTSQGIILRSNRFLYCVGAD